MTSSVENKPGKRTCVVFSIAGASITNASMQQPMKKIFIADDEVDILDILKLMLRTHGFEVTTTSDPNIIFDFEPSQLPDVILLDIWMSGLDGRDICKKLKQTALTSHIPVIFISANSNIIEIAEECDAEGYIAKPFEMTHLLNTINASLHATK